MRKIIITEGQADKLSGALLKVRRFPDFLMDAVKGNATPIGDCKYIYGNFIENSLRKRYEEILGFFNDDISEHSNDEVHSKLSKLFSRCMKKEEPIKDNLQSICYNKIVEKFEIPDGAFKFHGDYFKRRGCRPFTFLDNFRHQERSEGWIFLGCPSFNPRGRLPCH